MHVYAVGKPELPPLKMPERFRLEITFFMTPAGDPGVPPLAEGEYFIRRADVVRWLDDGFVSIVSPLDAATKAEIELAEYHETFLEWLQAHDLEHVRVG